MRHRSILSALVAVITLAAITASLWRWREIRRDAEVVEWLRAHAVPLQSTDPAADPSDLHALGRLIGDARIVGVGEATHGTREHYLYKHRLLRFLVAEKGFRAIGFESPWPTGLPLNAYVLGGEGDPAQLLRNAVFGVWATQEVLDMVRWMREYNSGVAPDQRVEFVGIDMQLTRDAAKAVRDYLDRVDPDFVSRHEKVFDVLVEKEVEGLYLIFDRNEIRARNTAETRKLSAAVREILARFDSQRDRYVALSSGDEFDMVRQHARIIMQEVDVCEDANSDDRDRYMAENVDWYLSRNPGKKMMIWAHNGHVALRDAELGHYLKKRHGADYVSVGFVLGSGTYRALDARNTPASEARTRPFEFEPGKRTLNSFMKATGLPLFAVDIRPAVRSDHPIAERVFRIREGYGIVVKSDPNPLATIERLLPATHDILIFIEPTSAARPLHKR